MPSVTNTENLSGSLEALRAAALVAVAVGAVGSVVLLVRAGENSPQRLLLVILAIWVLAPYAALVLAALASKRRSAFIQATLHGLMLCLTAGSLAIYGYDVWKPPTSQRAFVFVVVPLGAWVLIAIVVPIAALISTRRSRRSASER